MLKPSTAKVRLRVSLHSIRLASCTCRCTRFQVARRCIWPQLSVLRSSSHPLSTYVRPWYSLYLVPGTSGAAPFPCRTVLTHGRCKPQADADVSAVVPGTLFTPLHSVVAREDLLSSAPATVVELLKVGC